MSRASCFFELRPHPRLGGSGYCVGADGDTAADVVADLRARYGERLARIVDSHTGELLYSQGATPKPAVVASTAESGGTSRSADPAGQVIAALLAAGWAHDGRTAEQIIHSARTGKPKFDENDRPLVMPSRPRLRKGGRCVTVGRRTTCFYIGLADYTGQFVRVRTRDMDAVLAASQGEK